MMTTNIDKSANMQSIKVPRIGTPLTSYFSLRSILRLVLMTVLFLGISASMSQVFASSGGESETEMVGFFSTGFMWSVINFSIIVFLLYKFGKEPLKEALKKRQETIEKNT